MTTSGASVRTRARRGGAAHTIDPRIAARRDEVEQAHSRKVRRRLIAVLTVLAMIAGAVGLTRTPLLDVDHVEVGGNSVVSTAEVEAAGGVSTGDRMIGVDTGVVAARIEDLPWVRTASASRHWPGTIRITVSERRPVAVVDGPAGDVAVDATGRVLGPPAADQAALIRLDSTTDAEPGEHLADRWRPMLTVAARLPDALRSWVSSVGAGETGIVLTLTSDTVVELCDVSELDAKLGALLALVQRADPATAATIDVCVPGAPALTRTPRRA